MIGFSRQPPRRPKLPAVLGGADMIGIGFACLEPARQREAREGQEEGGVWRASEEGWCHLGDRTRVEATGPEGTAGGARALTLQHR